MLLKSICLVLFLTVGICVAQDPSLRQAESAFDRAKIPQDIQLTFNPKGLLDVGFPSGEFLAVPGSRVPRNNTAGPPTFFGRGDLGAGPFVVAAIDPDAPTPEDPTEAQIRHYLGGNFFLRDGSPGVLRNTTAAISQFIQPTPPAGSTAHRYIFLLFDQPRDFNTQTLITTTTSIANFNLSIFAQAVGLGEPIAGTFMLVAPPAS